jgi:antitoxin component YwqK of YwqJK toxin-antitoxin module
MKVSIVAAALAAFALTGFTGCGSEEKENLARRIVYHPGNSQSIKLEWTVKKLPGGDTALHGVMKEFYWGGANKKAVEYKDGLRDGTAQAWYDNGAQQWLKSYAKGRKVSVWRLFYSDGNPWLVVNHNKEGEIEGTVQKWDRMNPDTPT